MKLQHALLALFLCLPVAAQAHGRRHHHYSLDRGEPWRANEGDASNQRRAVQIGSRPARWCGWWMRQNVGRDPGPQFNLARSWASYGAAAPGPAPGVIGVMPHHVFKVIAVLGHDRRGT